MVCIPQQAKAAASNKTTYLNHKQDRAMQKYIVCSTSGIPSEIVILTFKLKCTNMKISKHVSSLTNKQTPALKKGSHGKCTAFGASCTQHTHSTSMSREKERGSIDCEQLCIRKCCSKTMQEPSTSTQQHG
mmetsp:Transcript_10464/g.28623  ORF Transcript_10464/g.28623 Transcript_10464/m.28623 type:complete len:131 (-) Transcript_10464:1255-1647(-)